MMSGRVQKVCYGFIATVLPNGQAVHLPDYRRLNRVFLPADFFPLVYPPEPERCAGRVDPFLYGSTHVRPYPFRGPSTLGAGDPGFDK